MEKLLGGSILEWVDDSETPEREHASHAGVRARSNSTPPLVVPGFGLAAQESFWSVASQRERLSGRGREPSCFPFTFNLHCLRCDILSRPFFSSCICSQGIDPFLMAKMGVFTQLCLVLSLFASSSLSLPHLPGYEAYNLNQNIAATTPLEYWGEWKDHVFHPSPDNWRMPFYSLFLDRFVNGDPSNDNSNGTAFEVDMLSTQLRAGGDISGLVDTLDYLQGMGIKVSNALADCTGGNSPFRSDRRSTFAGAPSSTSHGLLILSAPWT